jgi:hypothetical protein
MGEAVAEATWTGQESELQPSNNASPELSSQSDAIIVEVSSYHRAIILGIKRLFMELGVKNVGRKPGATFGSCG